MTHKLAVALLEEALCAKGKACGEMWPAMMCMVNEYAGVGGQCCSNQITVVRVETSYHNQIF